jgi:hypothetical protein
MTRYGTDPIVLLIDKMDFLFKDFRNFALDFCTWKLASL